MTSAHRTLASRLAAAAAFLSLVAVGLAREAPVCWRSAYGGRPAASMERRIRSIRTDCLAAVPFKMAFVRLHGAFVRLLGQHLCNDVVRMRTGDMLAQPYRRRVPMADAARNAKRFADFCASNGVAFAYVLLPKKLDVGQRLMPPGCADRAYANADDLLSGLKRQGVPFVDWRLEFAATPADVVKNFYCTDHHWNTESAFRATGMLVDEVCNRCRISSAAVAEARNALAPDRWKRKVLPHVFLGSLGKRTGPYFAGCDDVTVLTPRFATELTFEVPSKRIKLRGSFRKTLMRRSGELREVNDQFVSDAYSALYVGGLYPFARSVNVRAPLDLKVMLIGDSYARPVSAFAATAVREVIMVDPRRRSPKAPSLAELVRREKPDVVVQMQTPRSLSANRMTGPKTRRKVMFEYGL